MNTATRLAQLNTACKGSLSITHYESDGWVIHSYKVGTPLEMDGVYIADHDIKVAVKKAWEFVFEKEVGATEQEASDDREHEEHEDFMSREETISLNEQAER